MSVIIDNSIKKAAKGTVIVLVGTVVSSLLLFGIKVLIVRTTTTDELGAYTLTVAVVSILTLVATLGIHEGIARYVAIYLGSNNRPDADSLSRTALRIVFISGVVAAGTLYLSADLLAIVVFRNVELAHLFRIAALSIPFFVLLHTLGAIMRGHGIVVSRIYFMDIGIPLLFAVSLCGIYYWRLPFISIMYAYVASIVVVCLFMVGDSYRKIGVAPFSLAESLPSGELMRFSLPLLIGIVMAMVMNWADVLLLGRYTGSKTVGIYDAGSSLARLLQFPLNALEFVFLPIAGELHARGQSDELSRTYQVLTKWVFFLTFPIFMILFTYPEQIITFLFGARFIAAVPALRILACGYLFHTFWGPNGILMVIIGMSREISLVSVLGAIINIAANYLLISWYAQGIVGAAGATIATYVALNLLVSYIIFRKTGIQPFSRSYLKSIAGAVCVGGIFFLVSDSLSFSIWFLPLYLVFIATGNGLTLLLTKSIEREDVSLLKTVLTRVLGARAGL